ncbi:MAG: radical SAM protein [Verrucomicrobiales bacterium]|nr:radical SAM protein [Verrucomicrobiales bacterium]
MKTDLNPNEHYEIANGRIQTRSLEVHIVDHCNLRCWGCCSLSPVSAKSFYDPDHMKRQLSLVGKAISPRRLKLVGGEPLLHPEIIKCLEIARAAEVAPSLSVTSNGFLLPRMKDEFWELVDHMTISLYPDPPLPESVIETIKAKAREHEVELNWKKQDNFVGMDRDDLKADEVETQAIYETCWLRRSCHLIAHDRFYTCTRPSHVHSVSGLEDSPYLNDGIPLSDDPNLAEQILEYLVGKKPLETCRLCLGGDAPSRPHHQLKRDEIIAEQTLRRQLYRDNASVPAP